MNDVVQDAVQVIVPLLSAGAGAAAHELAEQAGSRLSETALRVLDRIRQRVAGAPPDAHAVEGALRAALADGDITEADVQTLVIQAGRISTQNAGHSIYNGPINVTGDFHG